MSSDFTLLAEHVDAARTLAGTARHAYVDSLPPDLARQVRELLQFEQATLDLSQVPVIELVLDVLADPAPECIGRWQVQELIGRGGMASVYRVERSEGVIRQLAACKIGYARDDLEDGLRRETATLLDLNHPGIAHVLDFGHTDGGRPYMVSEWIEGTDIVSFANQQELSLHARLSLFENVLSAVAHAHERLLLHQDIKPGNILVDSAGRPRLIDFGLATVLSGNGDSPVLGYTPRYASPEQVRAERLTVRSDIYSLGVTLTTLLEDVAPARSRDDAQAVIAKATQEEPTQRYASANEMAADLRAIRQSRPIAAHAGSTAHRLKRFIQRHPLPMALGSLVIISILLGAIVSFWLAQQAFDAARRADVSATTATAVQDFLLRDIVGRADPADASYDKEAGIVGVIDAATAAAASRFANEPLTAAAVHATLSAIHRNLGRYDVAAEQAVESARLYASEVGDTDDATLNSRYLQVRALASGQQLDDAESVLDETDQLAGERLHQTTRLALSAAVARGQVDSQRGRAAEMQATHTRVLWLWEALSVDDMVIHAASTNALGEAFIRQNQAARAIEVLQAAPLTDYPHISQSTVHLTLARAFRNQKDFLQALHHAQQGLELNRKYLGEDHYSTLITISTLSSIHHSLGDCAAALDTGLQAYESMTRVYGEQRQASLIERGNYGAKLLECEKHTTGLEHLEASVAALREHYGAKNFAAQAFSSILADHLETLDRPADAVMHLETLTPESRRSDENIERIARLHQAAVEAGDSALARRLEALQEAGAP